MKSGWVSVGCCLAIAACGDAGAGGDSGADAIDINDGADTINDGGGDGFTVVPGPILERASLGTWTCAVGREAARVVDGDFRVESLIAVGDHAVASQAGQHLALARAELSGELGPAVALDVEDYAASQASLALSGDGASIGAVWLRQDGTGGGTIMFARVAADDLAVEVAAKVLAIEGASYGASPRLALGPAGAWGLVVGVSDGGGTALRYWPIDAEGGLGAAVTLARGTSESFGFAATLIGEGDHWAALWAQGGYDHGEVWFARFGDTGLHGEALRVSEPAGEVSSGLGYAGGDALVAIGGRTFATFTETRSSGEFPDQKTSVIARVAVIDAAGDVELHALQAHVQDMTVSTPQLAVVGDALALAYTWGSVIYVCGGCITDYDVHVALLDPATLAPVAAEAVLRHDLGGARNGLTNPRVARVGTDLLVAAALDFHALSYPATGVITCEPM